MKATIVSQFNSESQISDPTFSQSLTSGVETTARAGVVNRTRRVVRQRAKLMQARRSKVRSLMLPLITCSALLILTVVAVWFGLYQSEAAEAAGVVQADVAALATNDASNQILVLLLWFVPVTLAVLGAIWLRHVRVENRETIR